VHGTYLLDGIVYSEMESIKNTNIKNLHDSIVKNEKNSSIKAHAEKDIKHFEEVMVELPQKVESTISYYVEHFVYTIFRGIIIPFGAFFILFLCSQWVLVPLFRELIYWSNDTPVK